MISLSEKELAGYIDHTLLNATATTGDIRQLCQEAKDFGFGCVCVNPRWVSLAVGELSSAKPRTGGVVSLPLGTDFTSIKVAQTKEIIDAGAEEVDMVADLAAIVEGDEKYLSNQLQAVLEICHQSRPKVLLKVIIESAALNEEQIRFACQRASDCGVDFVKTSTGMNPAGGATVEDIKLMKKYAGNCKVKAAGGISSAKQAFEMIEAGAERIGTSSSVAIIKEFRAWKRQ
ncbi:MAG: deoxyribose-phosphate aldolase [Planctomycetota bacterium]|jgi:deoxyribose-phosphate aldolase